MMTLEILVYLYWVGVQVLLIKKLSGSNTQPGCGDPCADVRESPGLKEAAPGCAEGGWQALAAECAHPPAFAGDRNQPFLQGVLVSFLGSEYLEIKNWTAVHRAR